MAFVHNGITLNPYKEWTHQDGRQFPANFILQADIPTRESIGVTMVDDVTPLVVDQEYYWSTGDAKDLATLKVQKIAETKAFCASVLSATDALITKALDQATSFAEFKAAKPAAMTTYREAMRTVSNTRESEINACTTVEQLRLLFKADAQIEQVDSEGNVVIHPPLVEQQKTDAEGNGVVDSEGNPVMVNEQNPLSGMPVMVANPALATPWPDAPTE